MPRFSRPRLWVAALSLGAATVFSACSSTGLPPNNPSASPSLNETRSAGPSRWELVRWTRADGTQRELPHGDNGEPIVFNFSDGIDSGQGTVSGTSGCNRFTGGYGKTDSGIRFDRLAGTRMACPGARMETETALLKAMQTPFTTVGTQPSAGSTGRQVVWKTADGELLQFVEREGVGRRGDKVDPATGSTGGTEKIVYIDSQRVECTGVGKMQCYRWRDAADKPWQFWYGPIEGLDFEPGVAYKLRVKEYQVPNPPADASAIRWQVLEIVERKRGG
ncbi:META and DUF4377 domain-containing protein [Cupriavidus agavae]|uniref:META domain-containing protein n=1 Tax=Cupriavidus agavae TaxID=1001822 RepID=A0A4Q7S7K2_9BURK|nr:META and DUF4377 domain-containing protein [Cupriavidus agavae]RZT41362.1 META domain-containing protein [Cupriavidus agavae]